MISGSRYRSRYCRIPTDRFAATERLFRVRAYTIGLVVEMLLAMNYDFAYERMTNVFVTIGRLKEVMNKICQLYCVLPVLRYAVL